MTKSINEFLKVKIDEDDERNSKMILLTPNGNPNLFHF